MTLMLVSFFTLVIREIVRSRHAPVAMGSEMMIGKTAKVLSEFTPVGFVKLDGEDWRAVTETPAQSATLHPGDTVKITGVEGVTLITRPERNA